MVYFLQFSLNEFYSSIWTKRRPIIKPRDVSIKLRMLYPLIPLDSLLMAHRQRYQGSHGQLDVAKVLSVYCACCSGRKDQIVIQYPHQESKDWISIQQARIKLESSRITRIAIGIPTSKDQTSKQQDSKQSRDRTSKRQHLLQQASEHLSNIYSSKPWSTSTASTAARLKAPLCHNQGSLARIKKVGLHQNNEQHSRQGFWIEHNQLS